MKAKKILAMLSAITMVFSATVAYFPKFANENAFIAKAEEMEEWESPPLDEDEIAEESTGFIEDITVEPDQIAILAASEVTDDGWQYYANGDEITISGYSGDETALVVPESIDGKDVTAIANRVFANNKKITSIDLGSVQKLGYKVFEGCTGLKEITIPKTVIEAGDSYYGGCLAGSSVETVTFEEGIAGIPNYVCKYASSVKTVIMPEKEDTLDGYIIGNGAFQGTSLQSVTIPESVTAINSNVFCDCALLTDIVIPDNVTWIGNECFLGCKRLKNIQLGAVVSEMGYQVFSGCSSLAGINLANISKIGYKAFKGCTTLKEITIPKTVIEAGDSYYGGCLAESSVETVTFEEGIAKIPNYVCKYTSSVKTVIMPEKENTLDGYIIGNGAFQGTSLQSVTIPESVTAINSNAFCDCALLTDIVIPDNVTWIGNECFFGCKRLKNIQLGAVVSEMGYQVFSGCSSLAGINLANINKIGYKAFKGCTTLKEITIPKTVIEAGDSYYGGCLAESSVETVTFEEGIAGIPNYVCKYASSVKTVIMPEKEDTLDGYIIGNGAFQGTSLQSVTIPESVTAINSNAFCDCALLTDIVIPDNVTWIGNECFFGCKRLKNIQLGAVVSEMGYQVFSGCSSLAGINLANISKIGYKAFKGCTTLKEITIPKTVIEAGDSYYGGCLAESSVETVTFEEGIAKIPNYVCKYASSVKTVIMPEKEDTLDGYVIGNSAFEGTSLTSVTIPESITGINDYAFKNCELLTDIVIPNNVNYIGRYCFEGCKRLKNISIGKNVETIEEVAFKNCVGLTSIDLGSVKKLDEKIFEGCTGIKEITIPKTVTKVGDSYWGGCLEGSSIETLIIAPGMKKVPEYIATNCTSLKTVYLPDSVSEIGNHAFRGCSNLTKIISNRTALNFSANSFEGCLNLDDKRFTVFDRENTYLNSNSELGSVNGIVNYSLKYKLMPSTAEGAKNIKLRLNIPAGMTLLLDSVQSKNLAIDGNNLSNGVVSVNNSEGELRFSARITEIGNYEVSAELEFNFNNETWKQTIGKSSVECPDVTIAAPETVNKFSAEVYGIASKGAEVTIYVNDTIAETLTANSKTGKYKGTVALPAGSDGKEYTLVAECGNIFSEEVKIVYSSVKPVVEKVLMGYNHSDYKLDITDVLKKGTSPVISYNPTYPISFEIEVSNSEKVKQLFVTSTKGNAMKYLEAFYDEESGVWKAEGYFDPDNHSYVPGAINISIIENESVILDNSYDYEADQTFADMPQEYIDNSSVDIISESENSLLANVNVSNDVTSDSFQIYSSNNNDGIYIDGEYYTADTIAKNPEKYGFTDTGVKTIENGKTVTYYTHNAKNDDIIASILLDTSADLSTIDDIWTGKYFLELIEGDAADNIVVQLANEFVTEEAGTIMKDLLGNSYEKVSKALSFGSDVLEYAAQIEMADGNSEYITAATILFGIKCFNTFGGTEALLLSVGITPPLSTVIKFGVELVLDTLDSYLMDCIRNNKQFSFSGFIRFIIDPSGIVYEAVIGNPVEGATVTVYFKDPETEKSVKWDASDYDQLNPLLTDEEGKYLWDVPEGQWKVVCEKEGYETVETDWMDIPPVRTDVNLSLVSNAAPELVSAVMDNDGIKVKFSKFVDISTVTSENLVIADFEGAYTITPQLINADDKYADTFILSGDFSDKIKTVSITDGITSYAGKSAKNAEINVTDSGISNEPITTTTTATTTTSTTTAATSTTITEKPTTTSTTVTKKPAQTTAKSTTTAKPITTKPVLIGDVNNDGSVDSSDASDVLIEYAKIQTGSPASFSDTQKIAADVNNDDKIDSSDASSILVYYSAISTGRKPSWN